MQFPRRIGRFGEADSREQVSAAACRTRLFYHPSALSDEKDKRRQHRGGRAVPGNHVRDRSVFPPGAPATSLAIDGEAGDALTKRQSKARSRRCSFGALERMS